MSAAWQTSFAKYPALEYVRRGDWSGMSAAMLQSPEVAQKGELLEPQQVTERPDGSRVIQRERWLSALANEHPVIAESLARARNHDGPHRNPQSVAEYGEEQVREWEASDDPYLRGRAEACRAGVDDHDPLSYADYYPDRLLLNTGRPPQPRLPGGREYTLDDLRRHEANRPYYEGPHVVQQIATAQEMWQLDHDRVYAAGNPVRVVILHNHPDDWGTSVVPVPINCTAERRAQLLWMDNRPGGEYEDCWHCGEDEPGGIDAMLLVTCGPVLRVFPTCRDCHDDFQKYFPHGGLDFQYVSDRSFFQSGLPDDRFL